MEDDEAPPMVLEEDSKAYRIVNRTVKAKLVEMFPDFGIDDPDNVMCEYIQVLLCNQKQKSQVIADLTPFLEDGAKRFTQWLWDYLRFLADSYQEQPRLSARRTKSVARDIELIHDKRKRDSARDEDFNSGTSHRSQSSSRRSVARSSRSCGRHERRHHHHRSSSKAATRPESPAVIEIEDSKPPRRSSRKSKATTESVPVAQPYPVAYQQPVTLVQYVPGQPMAPGAQPYPSTMTVPTAAGTGNGAMGVPMGPPGSGMAMLAPPAMVRQPDAIARPQAVPGTYQTTMVSGPNGTSWAIPNGHQQVTMQPEQGQQIGVTHEPNRRPSWLPAEELLMDDDAQPITEPQVRFVVTFREKANQSMSMDDNPSGLTLVPRDYDQGGRRRAEAVVDNFGHGRDTTVTRLNNGPGPITTPTSTSTSLHSARNATLCYGTQPVPPPAGITLSISNGQLTNTAAVRPLMLHPQPSVTTAPTPLLYPRPIPLPTENFLVSRSCNPMDGADPLGVTNFIPANNYDPSVYGSVSGPLRSPTGRRNIVATFREEEPPAFKRHRTFGTPTTPSSSSLVIDFDDDDDDDEDDNANGMDEGRGRGRRQDWADRNMDLMANPFANNNNNGDVGQSARGGGRWQVLRAQPGTGPF